MTETCQQDHFPILAGGSHDEHVTCTHYDRDKTNYTIVAGHTSSPDFTKNATNLTSYGFAYAIDYRGNWIWGKYFANGTANISEITTCKVNNKGKLTLGGFVKDLNGTRPVVFALAISSGKVENLIRMEHENDDNTTEYRSFRGIYSHVENEKTLVYTSFIRNKKLVISKINATDQTIESIQLKDDHDEAGLV
jgi:hypothetical protein